MCNGGQASAISGNGEDGTQATWHGKQAGEGAGLYGSPEPDFATQVERAFENLKATLTAAGCSFEDLIDVTTFHTDPESQFSTIMQVKQTVFPKPPYPNWTAVGVNWLAGFDFEIKVIARIPEHQL